MAKPSYPGDGVGHTVMVEVGREELSVLIPIRDRNTGEIDRCFRKKFTRPKKVAWVWDGKEWRLRQ